MPAVAARTLTFTPEEYFAWEETQVERHEYHFGEVFPMSGGTYAHARVSMALGAALVSALRGTDCAVLSEAMRVEVLEDRQYVYPDVTVVCGQPVFWGNAETTLRNPTIVCEVLSPGTADYDRGEKFALYRAVPSIQAVLYVDPDRRWVQLSRRTETTWTRDEPLTDGSIEIGALGVTLRLDEIYG